MARHGAAPGQYNQPLPPQKPRSAGCLRQSAAFPSHPGTPTLPSMHYRSLPALALLPTLLLSTTHAAETGDPLDTVLITASRIDQQARAERDLTPGSITLIDARDLQQRSVTQLADMLRYVPGVWAESQDGGDGVYYSSRGSNLDATGFDNNGILFLLDGLPASAADGTNHNRAPDPQHARHVVVAHGANALAWGASTLGGAVDITTPTARDDTPSGAALSAGSFGQRAARATLGGTADRIDALLSAATSRRDGYRNHSQQENTAFDGNLGLQLNPVLGIRFYASHVDNRAQLPRELTGAEYAADPRQAHADALEGDLRKDVRAWRLALKTTAVLPGDATLELGFAHERQALYHPIVSTPTFSLLIDTDHHDNTAMLRYRHRIGAHELLYGTYYGSSTITGGNYQNIGGNRGALMWTSDDAARTLTLFAMDRWHFAPRWTLVYGSQYVAATRDAGGVTARYRATNPRAGLIRSLGNGAEWHASLGRTWEAPTTYQLVDDKSGDNRPLRAMHGAVVESGLRGRRLADAARFDWDVSAYWTALRQEILAVDDVQAPGTSLATNIGRTTHAGIEALLGASLAVGDGGARLEPLLSATWNIFRFDADPEYGNNRLPVAPRWFARGELMYRPVAHFGVGPTFDFIGPRYVDFANTWRTGSFGLLGLRASVESGPWMLHVEARNLLDRRHVATVSARARAMDDTPMLYPGAPRALYLGMRYQR